MWIATISATQSIWLTSSRTQPPHDANYYRRRHRYILLMFVAAHSSYQSDARVVAEISDLTPSQLYDLNQVSSLPHSRILTNSCPKSLYDDSIPARPLIDQIVPMSVLRAEYENGSASFVQQIDWLINNGFDSIRRTRGASSLKFQLISS
jgi:hypothetical protein